MDASPAAANNVAEGEKRTLRIGLRREGNEWRSLRSVFEKIKIDPDACPEAVRVPS